MRVLLDTHTLLWGKIAPANLSRRAAAIIADPSHEILVSAASAWEIATKVRLGKLPGAAEFEQGLLESMEESGYMLLAIEGSVAIRAGRFPALHRDPFDRIIAAQALAYDIPVLGVDAKLDAFGVHRIW
ncbi:MAG: type II toxin-antitoxin system VapC family toxin [Acidobacteriaceae bacterium]